MEAFVPCLSTQLDDQIFYTHQTTNFIVSYKYPQFMLRLNSNNQIVSLYFYDNKKQTTIVNSLCHFKPNMNHLRSTSTYTSYFLSLLFVTKYNKLVVHIRRWRFRQVRPNVNVLLTFKHLEMVCSI